MKKFGIKFFANMFFIALLFSFGYYFARDFGRLFKDFSNRLQPCNSPISYSIVSLDPRFGLTKEKLLENIGQAEKMWEAPISRELFQYSETGDLKINLIYDYRQQATDALKKIGITIHDDRASYDMLKAKYDSLIASYNKQKAGLEELIQIFNADKDAYEKEVSRWNKRGGAPKPDYDILEQKRIDLNNQVDVINQAKDALNEQVSVLNSTELVLNKLVATLNLQVSTYNEVSSSTGKEYSEGEYVRDASGQSINIFQFEDTEQLIRVFTHELGHALNIEHLANPKAIMYYLNEGGNEKMTEDDLIALKRICKIK